MRSAVLEDGSSPVLGTAETTSGAAGFYAAVLDCLTQTGVPFMVIGAYALREYTGIFRDTKDLDIACLPGDYPRLLDALVQNGYRIEIPDANWLAKATHGEYFIDIIFHSRNGLVTIDETWFEHASTVEMFGSTVKIVPVEELIWSKAYVADRQRFDGADIHHLILKHGATLDWHRLLQHMDRDWEILFAHLLTYSFVYPSERDLVPRWLMHELLARQHRQLDLPVPTDRICRGQLLSPGQYQIDLTEWDYEILDIHVHH